MKKKTVKTGQGIGYVYLDELDNVICESVFKAILGKIDSEYRFIPKSNIVMEQGLTSQMLSVISELIKEKVGIGVKKAEPLTEDELKEEHTA